MAPAQDVATLGAGPGSASEAARPLIVAMGDVGTADVSCGVRAGRSLGAPTGAGAATRLARHAGTPRIGHRTGAARPPPRTSERTHRRWRRRPLRTIAAPAAPTPAPAR